MFRVAAGSAARRQVWPLRARQAWVALLTSQPAVARRPALAARPSGVAGWQPRAAPREAAAPSSNDGCRRCPRPPARAKRPGVPFGADEEGSRAQVSLESGAARRRAASGNQTAPRRHPELRRKIEWAACPWHTLGWMGGRAGRPTTCEALVSWSPRACRVGSRGEVMRSTRRPGETPGTCWLVADAAALPVTFMAAGRGVVNHASCSARRGCRCVGPGRLMLPSCGRLMLPSCDRRPAARSGGAARGSAATGFRPERPGPRAARRRPRGLRGPAPARAAPLPAR
jgi:hypothetical protein